MSDGFARRGVASLDGRRFEPYDSTDDREFDRTRGVALDLIERLIAVAPSVRADLLQRVNEHLEAQTTKEGLYNGISPPRQDMGNQWDAEFARVNAQAVGVGAVHLELGAWSAFPDQRRDDIVAADGLSEFVRLDYDPRYALDVVGDAQRLPLKDASVDRIRADSVLEHLAYPHAVIEECFRVLRPGGWLHIVTPWVFTLHGHPSDFMRYSTAFYDLICSRAGFEHVSADSNAMSGLYYTLHNSAKTAVVKTAEPETTALRAIHLAVIALLGALVPFDSHFEDPQNWATSVQVLAVKPGRFVPSGRPAPDRRPFAVRSLELLACPACGGTLRRHAKTMRCRECKESYPVVRDVPLLVPMPYLSPLRRIARRMRHPRQSIHRMPMFPPPPRGYPDRATQTAR
jgi:SAM-dependent methyltransferase